MKLKQAIARADAARPNMISEETKAGWIFELEGEFAELMNKEPPVNSWRGGGKDIELLMPFPHDNVYELYLCAMIDNHNQESAAYANDLVVANAAIDAAKAWWRRHNLPQYPKKNFWSVM